jgi:hypothetical protein
MRALPPTADMHALPHRPGRREPSAPLLMQGEPIKYAGHAARQHEAHGAGDLLLGGRRQQVVLRVRQARHHALHAVLAAAEQHREEVDAERARQLGRAAHLRPRARARATRRARRSGSSAAPGPARRPPRDEEPRRGGGCTWAACVTEGAANLPMGRIAALRSTALSRRAADQAAVHANFSWPCRHAVQPPRARPTGVRQAGAPRGGHQGAPGPAARSWPG